MIDTELFPDMAGGITFPETQQYVNDALQHITGPHKYFYVEKVEEAIAKYVGRRYALMTSSCTMAITVALATRAIMIDKPHSEIDVAIPNLTWVADLVPSYWLGNRVRFTDVLTSNWMMKTYGSGYPHIAIPVELFGQLANMRYWDEFTKHNIFTIEDAAHAFGASLKDPHDKRNHNKRGGSFGDCAVFSFHRTKLLTSLEGGMLLTDDQEFFRIARAVRDLGRLRGDPSYLCSLPGFKATPNNLSAAMLLGQFVNLSTLKADKHRIMEQYAMGTEDIPGIRWVGWEDQGVSLDNPMWCPSMVWDNRYQLNKYHVIERAAELGVPIRPQYHELHEHAWVNQKYGIAHTPNANWIANHSIMLPSAYGLTSEAIEKTVDALTDIFSEYD